MRDAKEDKQFAQVVQKVAPQSRLLRIWKLTGGISAQMTVLEIEQPDGSTKTMIVRQHAKEDLKGNPQIAADEFKLLHLLHSVGLAVPIPYALDQSGEIFSSPYLVLEYIEGQPQFALSHVPDLLLQCARHLSKIHHITCSTLDLSFLPRQERLCAKIVRERPTIMDDSLDEGRIRETLEAVWPFAPHHPSVLLHGDFWPGNLLWKDGKLVAIVDWEDARVGDPLADVATTRLEILWAFGIDAMHHFTHLYQSMTSIDFTHLPYWDLFAALRPASKLGLWAADEHTEHTMREGHRRFLTQAFDQLPLQ